MTRTAALTGERTRMRVADLRPSDRNPRTISPSRFENLKRSLEQDAEFLDARPLLVNSHPGRENVVIAGNMRLRAAQALGWEEVPVLVVSLPPEIEAQWNLKDNNQWGEYDDGALAELLAELGSRGGDLEILGFEPDELERLLALAVQDAPGDDDGFDPTPPRVADTEPGDLYLLGPHRLVCGDCRDPRTWERLMRTDGASASETLADAMWTDPPYGVDLHVEGERAMRGDTPCELGPLLDAALAQADRRLRPGAPIYMAGPSGQLGAEFVNAWERVGWHLAQTLVWVKPSFVPGRSDYHHQHEAIYYGWKPGALHTWIGGPDKASVIDDELNVSRMRREDMHVVPQLMEDAAAAMDRVLGG